VRIILATLMVAGISATAAPATETILPASYQDEATSLTVSCGGLRAELIARMDYARQIHVDYVAVTTLNSDAGKIVGDEAWHRWWADTYVQTIKLLKQGCGTQNGTSLGADSNHMKNIGTKPELDP